MKGSGVTSRGRAGNAVRMRLMCQWECSPRSEGSPREHAQGEKEEGQRARALTFKEPAKERVQEGATWWESEHPLALRFKRHTYL